MSVFSGDNMISINSMHNDPKWLDTSYKSCTILEHYSLSGCFALVLKPFTQ